MESGSQPPPSMPEGDRPTTPAASSVPPPAGPTEPPKSYAGMVIPLIVVAIVAAAGGYLLGSSNSSTKTKTVTATYKLERTPAPTGATGTTAATGPTAATGTTSSTQAQPSDAGKGNDAQAKSEVVTAAEAMETCATDSNGSYANCAQADLVTVEPTLADAPSLTVSSTPTTYKISVEAVGTGHSFSLTRTANGRTQRSCKPAGQGGCMASGVW